MAIDRRLEELRAMEARVSDMLNGADTAERLKSGDGGGTSGDMEARVARLESDMSHVKDTLKSLDGRVEGVRKDVGTIQVDLGKLSTKVDHLPGKGFIFTVALGLLAAVGGIMAAIVRFIPHAP